MILFLGAPGSGKGTQSRLLKNQFGYEAFSVGDALRVESQKNTELGKKINNIILSGNFVDSDTIIDLLVHNVKNNKTILDGFPRCVEQAEKFEKLCKANSLFSIDLIVNFEINDKIAKNRLIQRRHCKKCNIPVVKNECEICKNCDEFFLRMDDKDSIIDKRLNLFHSESEKLVLYYKEFPNFRSLDATMDVDSIFEVLKKYLIELNLV